MSKSLWLPFWINICLLLCAIPTIGSLPHVAKLPTVYTLPESDHRETSEEAGPLLPGRSAISDRHTNEVEIQPSIVQSIVHAMRRLRRLVTGRKKFQVLLCSFFLTALASSDTKLLVQYISKRYEWTFAQVGALQEMETFKLLTSCQFSGRIYAFCKSNSELHLAGYRGASHHS